MGRVWTESIYSTCWPRLQRCEPHRPPKHTRQLRRHCILDDEGKQLLKTAMVELGLSARMHDRILCVARSVADLEGSESIEPIFPRWTPPPGASAATPSAEDTPSEERLQRSPPKQRRRHPPRRGLSLPHNTLLLCAPPKSASQAHLGHRATTFGPVCRARQTSPRGTRQPQPSDPLQNHREHPAGHRHLRQLEDDVLRMPHHFRANVDQLLAQGGQVPSADRPRQPQLP